MALGDTFQILLVLSMIILVPVLILYHVLTYAAKAGVREARKLDSVLGKLYAGKVKDLQPEAYTRRRFRLQRGKMQSNQNLTHNVYINYARDALVW